MNYMRVALASVGAFMAYMVLGGVIFAALPGMKREFLKYPLVYRDHEGQMSHLPAGMAATFLSVVVLTLIYATMNTGGSGIREWAVFGVLSGLFVLGTFVLHNYANLNIGLKLTLYSAATYFLEWAVVGFVIGAIYKPR